MKAIGFANKFFTLWEITEETRSLGNGRSYIITHYNYIKNISFDRETTEKLYPGVPVDENLKGHSASWSSTKEVWDNVDTFRFGKYKDNKIDSVTDNNYLEWYWDNTSGDHKEYVGKVLESRGYEIRTSNYSYEDYYSGKIIEKTHTWLVGPEELEAERNNAREINEKLEEIKNATELIFTPTFNLNENGNICDNDCYNIVYHFNEVKENYYRGFPYYLPVLNGNTKRIKNKNIKITNFTYVVEDGKLTINIKNFEIIK